MSEQTLELQIIFLSTLIVITQHHGTLIVLKPVKQMLNCKLLSLKDVDFFDVVNWKPSYHNRGQGC